LAFVFDPATSSSIKTPNSVSSEPGTGQSVMLPSRRQRMAPGPWTAKRRRGGAGSALERRSEDRRYARHSDRGGITNRRIL